MCLCIWYVCKYKYTFTRTHSHRTAQIREGEYQLPPAKTDTAAPIHHSRHPYYSHLQLQLCHPHPPQTRQNFQHNSLQKLYSPKSIENLMIHSQDCRGFLMFEDFRKSEFGGSRGSLGVGVIRRLPTARLTVRRMMRVLLLVLLLLIAPISSVCLYMFFFYVCVFACIYHIIYVCTLVCVYGCVCMHICVYTDKCIYMRVCIFVSIFMFTRKHVALHTYFKRYDCVRFAPIPMCVHRYRYVYVRFMFQIFGCIYTTIYT